MLTPGKIIKSRQLWAGRPAVFTRELTDQALADMQAGVQDYVRNARMHQATYDGTAEG